MPILIKEHSAKTTVSPQTIWRFWSDVDHWNTWDSDIEWSKSDGPFQLGQTGKLKPKGGPVVKTKITECTPNKSFSDSSKLFLATIHFDHSIEQTKDGNIIKTKIMMAGPLAWLFAKLMGKSLAAGLEPSIRNLIAQAEAYEKNQKS